jgi:hypothetical protein
LHSVVISQPEDYSGVPLAVDLDPRQKYDHYDANNNGRDVEYETKSFKRNHSSSPVIPYCCSLLTGVS